MKIILTYNFADEAVNDKETQTTQTSSSSNEQAEVKPVVDGKEEPFDSIKYGDWEVNSKDGSVLNTKRPAKEFFLNPKTEYRKSKREQEEATYIPAEVEKQHWFKSIFVSPKVKSWYATRNDINKDPIYQRAMTLGRQTARTKALSEFGYIDPMEGKLWIDRNIEKLSSQGELPYISMLPVVYGKNHSDKTTIYAIPKVPHETSSMEALNNNQPPSWANNNISSFNSPKTEKQIEWSSRDDSIYPWLTSLEKDEGQRYVEKSWNENKLKNIGREAAPEEMAHAQIGDSLIHGDIENIFSFKVDEDKDEIIPSTVKHANNYVAENKIPSYAQSISESAVNVNAFRSDAGKYNTQLNYPEDYKAYYKFHKIYSPRKEFNVMLKHVSPMRTDNWTKQMLQLRSLGERIFEMKNGRSLKNDESLPEDIFDDYLKDLDNKKVLRTANNYHKQPRKQIPA